MAFERSPVQSRPGPWKLALFAFVLSTIDWFLTCLIGYEANPLLKYFFEHQPEMFTIMKMAMIPLYVFLGGRPERSAREGLWVIIGWYGATIVTEAVNLTFP